jgi:histidinol-phosphate aminotransferase
MDIRRRALLRHIAAGGAGSLAISALPHRALSAAARDSTTVAARPVRLHLSENAYGPSPAALAAIREGADRLAHRYADASEETLRDRLATLHRVDADRIVLGCGSSEILRMAVNAFAGNGRAVVLSEPSHDGLAAWAREAGARVVSVPLWSDHSHDLDRMVERADGATGLVYLSNPHNPTGCLTARRELETFLTRLPSGACVVIDEAYHEFVGGSADYASFIDRPFSHSRLIVTRTFSTIHGLAGLRVGYAIAAPEIVRSLAGGRSIGSVNALGAVAAIAALNDPAHVRAIARRNADERQEFCNQANARMLRTIDSQANFVMLNTGRAALEMVGHFKAHGVLVAGPFAGFDRYIRVSVGTPAEMREFWRVWDLLPPMHAMTM